MNFNLNHLKDDFSSQGEEEELKVANYSYRLSDILGRGCYGSVFKAVNNSTGNTVALKVIDMKRVTSSLQKILLQNEKAVIGLLISKPVAGVTEYQKIIETKTHTYIAMKLYEAHDLQKQLKTQRIDELTAKKYMLEILSAYIELRQIKIIHRDLKPANILIDKDGHLKITDFGFAVFQQEDTKTYNYCLGSPAYCSPESLQSHVYGVKSDVWALGTIAYKLITNKTPWKGRNNKELIENMKSAPIRTLVEFIKDESLKKLVCDFCQYDPERRSGISQLKQKRSQLHNQIYSEFSPKRKKSQKKIFQEMDAEKKPMHSQSERKKRDQLLPDLALRPMNILKKHSAPLD